MQSNYRITVRSDQSLKYWPDNKPSHFRIHLKSPLKIEGLWLVAITDIYARLRISGTDRTHWYKHLYISSDMCTESIVGDKYSPLLRAIFPTSAGRWMRSFALPQFVALRVKELSEVDILITDENDLPASFLTDPVTLTLHFRRCPFYC